MKFMKTIEVKRQLLEEALDQLWAAQQDKYVLSRQNVIGELEVVLRRPVVTCSYFKILDKDGIEMPDHWSGRRRTYDEAKKMVDSLNKNGEYSSITF